MRQVDDAADDRRIRATHRRTDPARRRRHGLHAAAQAQREHGVPELRAVPPPQRVRQRRLRPAAPQAAEGGDPPAGGRRPGAGAADRPGEAQAVADVGQVGPPQDLYEEPTTTFVADFLGVSNLMTVTAQGESNGRCKVALGEFELYASQGDTSTTGETRMVIRPERVRLEAHEATGE